MTVILKKPIRLMNGDLSRLIKNVKEIRLIDKDNVNIVFDRGLALNSNVIVKISNIKTLIGS